MAAPGALLPAALPSRSAGTGPAARSGASPLSLEITVNTSSRRTAPQEADRGLCAVHGLGFICHQATDRTLFMDLLRWDFGRDSAKAQLRNGA